MIEDGSQNPATSIENAKLNVRYKEATVLTSMNFGKSLYVVVAEGTANGNQTLQAIGLSETKTFVASKFRLPIHYMAKHNGYAVGWLGAYEAQGGGPAPLTYSDFVARPEVAIARKILQSIRY